MNPIVVKGRLVDKSKKPIEGARVTLKLKTKDLIIGEATTDSNGNFQFSDWQEYPSVVGDYEISFQSEGYEQSSKIIKIEEPNNDVDMRTIELLKVTESHTVFWWLSITAIILLPVILLSSIIVLGLRYIKRRAVLNERLRRREIPYIVGDPIHNPSHFFGRRELLEKLRDSIDKNSYALVGDFRIGKTSIQIQFKQLLESLDDPEYVFLPVFINLEHLGRNEDHFFHFLGQYLVQLAEEREVPRDILDNLEYQWSQSLADYDSLSFLGDIKVILEYWCDAFSPREPIIIFQIDEITIMDNFDYDTLLKLRAVFIEQPLVNTVLSGRSIPRYRDQTNLSPWWNFLSIIEVEPLTPTEAKELIVEPVLGLFRYDEDAIEHIIARAQGRPFSIQSICSDILHYKYVAGRVTKRITLEDLYTSIEMKTYEHQEEKV